MNDRHLVPASGCMQAGVVGVDRAVLFRLATSERLERTVKAAPGGDASVAGGIALRRRAFLGRSTVHHRRPARAGSRNQRRPVRRARPRPGDRRQGYRGLPGPGRRASRPACRRVAVAGSLTGGSPSSPTPSGSTATSASAGDRPGSARPCPPGSTPAPTTGNRGSAPSAPTRPPTPVPSRPPSCPPAPPSGRPPSLRPPGRSTRPCPAPASRSPTPSTTTSTGMSTRSCTPSRQRQGSPSCSSSPRPTGSRPPAWNRSATTTTGTTWASS